jgi:hypothetical protein
MADWLHPLVGCCFLSRLELSSWQSGLSDDGLKCPGMEFGMVQNRYGDGCIKVLFLHHYMTASLTHFKKAVPHKNCADLFA